MGLIENLKIRRQYKKLVASVEGMKMFDGRGKGVDVYICEKCGRKTLTRYKDKGVTPFVMQCSHCDGYAQHVDTITEQEAEFFRLVENIRVQNWARPPLWWLLKHKKAVDHVLNGGLVLEQEVLDETPHIYQQEQPSLPSGLDEAAEKYSENILANNEDLQDAIEDAFKAGAEWMAGQGIKLHGRILPGTRCNLYIESDCFDRGYRGLNYKFSESNDVDMFVQIRKKQ